MFFLFFLILAPSEWLGGESVVLTGPVCIGL